jgi:glutaminase
MEATLAKSTVITGPQDTSESDVQTPVLRFLNACHADYVTEGSGVLANYIPELSKANPASFGIGLCTIDGHVYEIGDTKVTFTIQSISKAFVFALALELLGSERVEAVIGVEPSGDAFNSIRLTADNRPFNPMVNAGAIACTGLIYAEKGDGAFDCIVESLSRFAGRKLDVDESVFGSERSTGDRNRAIAWLLRNYSIIGREVDQVLDAYFRQCSVLVTARDLAVMAATLANRGINPITGVQVVTPNAVARTLSVMTSSGMYDYAGEWTYRVGMPAKSGVGGGIIAALPSQLGLGTYSPLLDTHGNSVRGLKVCEALSSHFDLHVLIRGDDVRTCIIADYDIGVGASRRSRPPSEQHILLEHRGDIRVIELVGALTFASLDYVSRQVGTSGPSLQILVLDFHRVPGITKAAARLLAEVLHDLTKDDRTAVVSGIQRTSRTWTAISEWVDSADPQLKVFSLLDEAIEWAEDQVIYRYGGWQANAQASLDEQGLLADLTAEELAELSTLTIRRAYQSGERIIVAGEAASSIHFLQSGMVSVKLPSGVRLATLVQGMVFGEMALIEPKRTADVWADTYVQSLELPLAKFVSFRENRPRVGELVMRNLAKLLSRRLIWANTKVEVLSGY